MHVELAVSVHPHMGPRDGLRWCLCSLSHLQGSDLIRFSRFNIDFSQRCCVDLKSKHNFFPFVTLLLEGACVSGMHSTRQKLPYLHSTGQ